MKNSKTIGFCLALTIALACHVSAQPVIRRTGIIEIIKADGTSVKLEQQKKLPALAVGDSIRVISGSIDVSRTEEPLNVMLGSSMALVKPGGRLIGEYNNITKATVFKYSIDITITTGGTAVDLHKGQKVRIVMNEETGAVMVTSLQGDVKAVANGVAVFIPVKSAASIIVNPVSSKVYIVAKTGTITVSGIDGEETKLSQGGSMDARGTVPINKTASPQAAEEKEAPAITKFSETSTLEIIEEEPAQPEFPEASPYSP
jgi:hypothetical protein